MQGTDLQLLADAALEAGEIAKRFFKADPTKWDKPDGAGPVTEADIAVNDMLHDRLRIARPQLGWLSEETEDNSDRHETDRQFIVDPIDGTRAFIEGGKDWSHSLAIAEHGQITAAAVFLPIRGLLYLAEKGKGATLNGDPIQATGQTNLSEATVLSPRPNFEPHHWKDATPPEVKRLFRSSLAYRLCLVAEGRFDAMLTLRPSWEWDIAAGSLIVQEAGGASTDKTGGELRFNGAVPMVNGVVSGGTIHQALIDRLI